ncbi:MAG TPA: enoyl-CoA hydratase-related protein [Pyrinomonadaceae bacterium]|nr:enoyl-CoA hydratase-related protein [Pyrinomonadaceae bacterium]
MMRDESSNIVLEEREVDNGSGALVCVVWLNRPAKLNALTRVMLEQLTELFRTFDERTNLRAVILTGTGQAAFCAGTDISELEGLDEQGALATAKRGQETCEAIELCGVPVIAAINGIAAGGGCELALACHLRVAAGHAAFTLPEIKLGMIPAYGGTQRLARAVGHGRALAAMLAGDSLAADEAHMLGLVNRVVAAEEVLTQAEALAHTLSGLAPLALRACLRAITRGARLALPDGLALEAELFSQLFATEDVREGTRAFLEKRAPVFNGR